MYHLKPQYYIQNTNKLSRTKRYQWDMDYFLLGHRDIVLKGNFRVLKINPISEEFHI